MLTVVHSFKMYKMGYLTFLAILFISFSTTFAVHTCYICSSLEDCKSLQNQTSCKKEGDTEHYLCQSMEDKTAGVLSRSCMKNNAADIKVCDELHLNGTVACYHCDRELCNSAPGSSGSIVIASIIAYLLIKFV